MSIRLEENLSDYPLQDTQSFDEKFLVSKEKEQEIRPLHIAIWNTMPWGSDWMKIEQAWLNLLKNSAIQIVPHFTAPDPRNKGLQRKKSPELLDHFDKYYESSNSVKDQGMDGVIVLGANIAKGLAPADKHKCDFAEEFRSFVDWAQESVTSSLYSCWSAHAALEHIYKVQKVLQSEKIWGVFPHEKVGNHALLEGLNDRFDVIHSRWNHIEEEKLPEGVKVLIRSLRKEVGAHVAIARDGREVFAFGHPEYETLDLDQEFKRDKAIREKNNKQIVLPSGYYENDDYQNDPVNTWRADAHLFIRNWINFVYQNTNFDRHEPLEKDNIYFK